MIQQGPEINYTSLTSADPTSKPKMAGSGKLKFAYNTGVEKGLTYTKFRRPGHVTVILEAKNWQKVDKFKLAYHLGSNNTDVDEKLFVVFEHTVSNLAYGYVLLPRYRYYFSSASFCF